MLTKPTGELDSQEDIKSENEIDIDLDLYSSWTQGKRQTCYCLASWETEPWRVVKMHVLPLASLAARQVAWG